jgi:hypothetical protein
MGPIKPRLTKAEIEALGKEFGDILGTKEVAAMLSRKEKTIDEWCSKGYLDGTFRKRGKHRSFLRDRVLDRVFNGPNWRSFDEQ